MGSAQNSSLQPEAELGPRDPLRVSPALALRPASHHGCINNMCAGVSYEQLACQPARDMVSPSMDPADLTSMDPADLTSMDPADLTSMDPALVQQMEGWQPCSSGMTADSTTACLL